MNTRFLRCIAILLIPCLIADPIGASGSREFLSRTPHRSPQASPERFSDQAIVAALVAGVFSHQYFTATLRASAQIQSTAAQSAPSSDLTYAAQKIYAILRIGGLSVTLLVSVGVGTIIYLYLRRSSMSHEPMPRKDSIFGAIVGGLVAFGIASGAWAYFHPRTTPVRHASLEKGAVPATAPVPKDNPNIAPGFPPVPTLAQTEPEPATPIPEPIFRDAVKPVQPPVPAPPAVAVEKPLPEITVPPQILGLQKPEPVGAVIRLRETSSGYRSDTVDVAGTEIGELYVVSDNVAPFIRFDFVGDNGTVIHAQTIARNTYTFDWRGKGITRGHIQGDKINPGSNKLIIVFRRYQKPSRLGQIMDRLFHPDKTNRNGRAALTAA